MFSLQSLAWTGWEISLVIALIPETEQRERIGSVLPYPREGITYYFFITCMMLMTAITSQLNRD